MGKPWEIEQIVKELGGKIKPSATSEENVVTRGFGNEDQVDSAPSVVGSNSITLLANGGSVYVAVNQKNDGLLIIVALSRSTVL